MATLTSAAVTRLRQGFGGQAFNVDQIRADFPILAERVHGQPLVYLDSANTSQKPEAVLKAMDEPIKARLYFSKRLGELSASDKSYFERIRTLLEDFSRISGGKLELEVLDPEPFSDAEERAVAAGLSGQRISAEGEMAYFGLAASNSTDNQEVIAFFNSNRENFVEYDITKLIHALSDPKKPRIGLMTSLPLDGGQNPMTQQQTPPWIIMSQIREFFDVETLEQNVTEVPARIDVLLVAQPTQLTPEAAYAIDRYLAGRTDVSVAANVKITSSWRHDMPEFYDVLPRQHIPMVQLQARMPSTDPIVNFNTPVELGFDANGAVAESTRCLMCNYNIWFDPFRCVLCGACADVCPEGVIHMVDINTLKSEGLLPELEEGYGWEQGGAMILDEERCIRCALCVKRCPFDAITMERFELQEVSTDGRLYKESYRDAQLAGTPGVAGGAR